MPIPVLAKLGVAGLGLFLATRKKAAPPPVYPGAPSAANAPQSPNAPGAVPSPTATPIALRMATVLATNDPFAIRFEAGRLRQEGYPAQAQELEREAQRIEAAKAAGVKPAPSAPVVSPLPAGSVTSPGFVPPVVPVPVPPAVVQTPAGPVLVPQPAVVLPQPTLTAPTTIPTPMGPVTLPSVPVSLPSVQILPLPALAKGETLSRSKPGQTYSEKTKLLQGKLASIGLLQPADVLGQFGPKTETAVKQFQLLANAYLKAMGKPVFLPTAGVSVSSTKVDGIWGNQSNDLAALAHAPVGSGATASYFGSLDFAPPQPLPATPLPGILPPMAPKPIEPRLALASRLAHNLSLTEPGQEDRSLVQLFQAQEGLKPSGYYNASTALRLAEAHGIVPAKPRYWTDSHTRKSKQNYRARMRELAKREPQRAEEWEQAGENL